jgi:hypothetical protein
MDLNAIEIHHLVRVAVGCNSCAPPFAFTSAWAVV